MVTFDHRSPGTDEAVWAADPRWDPTHQLVEDFSHLVVLSAHPDDETLGAGGLIARSAARGAQVHVIVATNGEASHPLSPTQSPAQLADVRRRELQLAIGTLAPDATITFVGIADGTIRECSDALQHLMAEVLSGCDSDETLLVVPYGGDGHRDHVSVSTVARAVANEAGVRLLEYPIWLWHWGEPSGLPWAATVSLALTPDEQALKNDAMSCHVSQSLPLSALPGDEVLLSPEFLRHFQRDFETFIEPARLDSRAGAAAGNRADQREREPEPELQREPEPQYESLRSEFFDSFYAGKSDPWGFETRWYEERKRAITMAALPHPRYRNALEIGSSTGVLTELLADRCDHLVAVDIARRPLELAAERLREAEHVEFMQLQTPEEWPEGSFDLVVLSEVGYYWSLTDLDLALRRAVDSLRRGGVLLACHWLHEVQEYPITGEQVHRALNELPGVKRLVRHEEEDFILEVFQAPPTQSVARRTGLVT
ncbi:PIG-L family deacetylase [Leifsonia sp. A12D58]|uniref:PIG-L family deacetylase n=1 Tax=Leifsonia sp. A12D58 TaxID=3397674 RepID=UPI0039E1789A